MWNRTPDRSWSPFLPLTLALLTSGPAVGAPVAIGLPPHESVGTWTITETVSPLTNAKTLSASTSSTEPLLNQLDLPQPATLVLRCREGTRAAYVAWPQILSTPLRSYLLSLPQTVVLKKLDDGPVISDAWVVSDSLTSAGAFDNLGAPKILATLQGAKRLVVRMSGQIEQDAVFDLTGVDEVIGRVESVCGVEPVVAHLPQLVESLPVGLAVPGSPEQVSATVASSLRDAGFLNVENTGGTVSVPLQPFKFTSRLADCGRVIGIPYLADGRVKTQAALKGTFDNGRSTLTMTIAGVMKTGMGVSDKALRCTSTGVFERELLQKVAAAAGSK